MRTRACIVLGAAALLLAPALARAAAPIRRPDQRRITVWAHPASTRRIRARPSSHAKMTGRLHPVTEDGFPEVYLVLRQAADKQGRQWVKLRRPRRPNGSTGWVPLTAMGRLHTINLHLVINRKRLRATLYRDDLAVWTAPIGIGKRSTPTPHGNFWIREKLAGLRSNPIYGPYALGTSAYSRLSDWPGGGVVGIHGTNEPGLIPGRPSHGCIRMRNPAIVKLYHLISIGTPVTIH